MISEPPRSLRESGCPGPITGSPNRPARSAGRPEASERAVGAAAIFPLIAALLSMAIGIYIVVTTAVMMIHGWSAVPFSDQWDELILDPWKVLSPWLYSQHNEHRILFPRLLFAIDALAFNGTNKFNFFCNFALAALLAVLIIKISHQYLSNNRIDSFWIAGIVLSTMLSAVQYFNFLWGFQVQFFGVEFAAAVTIFLMVMGVPRWTALVFALVFAGIALYTLSSGVVVLVLAVALALAAGRSKAQIAASAAAAAVLLASYLYGYVRPAGHTDPYASFLHPGTIRYAVAELGNPFGQVFRELHFPKYVNWDARFGTLGLALYLVATLSLLRRDDRVRRVRLVFVSIGAFTLGTALLTALGRLSFGVDQAVDARYASPMMLFWLALVMLAIAATRDRSGLRRLAMALSLPLLVALAWAQSTFTRVGLAWAIERRAAETALLANVADDAALRIVHPDPARPREEVGRLREQRLAIFADPWSGWLDTPLSQHVRVADPARCSGAIAQATRLPAPGAPQWRVSGWAAENPDQNGIDRIVITDKAGRIVGYARGGFGPITAGKPKKSGWRGHFTGAGVASIAAYALIDRERAACRLSGFPPPR